jgi:hypothetical protein
VPLLLIRLIFFILFTYREKNILLYNFAIMPIQKLRKCLKLFGSNHNFDEHLPPPGTVLLVDFVGFLYDCLLRYQESESLQVRLVLGDFYALHTFVLQELTYLSATLGYKLQVFVDGKNCDFYYEGDVTEEKRAKLDEHWQKTRNYIENPIEATTEATVHSIVHPPCAPDQIIESMESFNVDNPHLHIDIHYCIGNTDITIGRAFESLTREGENCYVYSADTNFAFMKGVKLILCEEGTSLHP